MSIKVILIEFLGDFTRNLLSVYVHKHSECPFHLLVCNSCMTSGEMVPSFKSNSKLQEFISFKETFIRVKHSKTYFVKKSEQETFLD